MVHGTHGRENPRLVVMTAHLGPCPSLNAPAHKFSTKSTTHTNSGLLNCFPATMRLTLLLLLACVAAGSNMSPTCGLDCFHNGYCEAGAADFSAHPTLSNGTSLSFLIETKRDGYHCNCRPGYTGLLCGVKYDDCTDSDHMCYNGGQCILGLSDIYGNDQLYCDCSQAVDKHGVMYVGKYCEIPKTQTCDDAGEVFCVNGGWCKSDYANYPRRPCHCGTLHDGPHCEFDAGAVPECTLKCHNGGACRLGMKKESSDNGKIDYDFWKKHSDYQYCECANGYYGLQCEVQSSKCGDHHCFHGGECITVTQGSQRMHYCDCTKTVGKGIAYAGEFCQYESDNYCDKQQTANGQLFCVNDGVCHSDGSQLGCECPLGFHGPICEFKDAVQVNEYENCTLVCENNGQCRNGAKDTSLLDKFGNALSNVSVSHDSNFEHCVCPDGFVGLTCETKIDVCEDAEHVCLHGSTCIPDQSDGIGSACNCESGSTSFVMLAGIYCEHKSTSICTTGGSGSSGFSFCVNKGECVDMIGEDGKE